MGLQMKGFMLYLMIGLAASRPQYNYQSIPVRQSVSLPNAQIMQILPSHALGHTYLPPAQQTQAAFPPLAPIPQYNAQPSISSQSIFKDVSQIPLQQNSKPVFSGQTNSFQGLTGQSSTLSGQSLPISNGFNTQSHGFSGQSDGSSNRHSQSSSIGSNGNNQGFVGQSSALNQQIAFRPQPRTIITKDIFVHTAPPDAEVEQNFNRQLESVPVRKNYRIIFIKAPTQNLQSAAQALKHAQTINEEKTVIYVLSKKADAAELQNEISQIQPPQTLNQKPEVYFIKYKTNEEAQRAQQEIQAQYDKLGGSTNIASEVIAPFVNAQGSDNISTSGSVQSASISTPPRQYLPNKV